MAPSKVATTTDSPYSLAHEVTENNLQPFFVLHEGSSHKIYKKSTGTAKTRRRIDLSQMLPKNGENMETEKVEDSDDHYYVTKQMEAFEAVWSKIESTVEDVLRNLNASTFNEIDQWVSESFDTITASGKPSLHEATRSFPLVQDSTSKQVFTGLVLTKNLEFVDDLPTFKELGLHLTSKGCHVANLSSMDISVKNGIGGCLRSLLRQLVSVNLDAPDMSILATWYREQGKHDKPILIIIDDLERCSGAVLSDFILMLSEWVLKIPVILIMGVATSLDSLRNILPMNVLHHLCPCKFLLGTPSERMDAVVEAVLVRWCSGFSISHKVAAFMRSYFICQDGTITSFMKALKIACALHFSEEPLSFILPQFLPEEECQVLEIENDMETMIKRVFDLPSCTRSMMAEQNRDALVHALTELKKSQKLWSIVLVCLFEVVKHEKVQLLDLYCEALDPELGTLRVSETCRGLRKDSTISPTKKDKHKNYTSLSKGGIISQVVHKLRNIPSVQLCELLKRWEQHTVDIPQINDKVKELLSMLKIEDGKNLKQDSVNLSKRIAASRSHLNFEKDLKSATEKAVRLAEYLVGNYMQPIECIAFHEIVCFKDVEKLRAALIGDPRRRIQVDLLDFRNIIQCRCCSRSDNGLLPSMNDSAILYTLAQEHGDLINLHDWYQSFKSVTLSFNKKAKHRTKHSPSPKKRKVTTEAAKPTEALIQARFCRAITELQITGLIRMPSKRRPDYVQRVAFGL